MKDAIDAFLLLNWLLNLGEQRDGSVDGVCGANNAQPDMFAACRICLAVWPKGSKAGSRIDAPLFIAKQ